MLIIAFDTVTPVVTVALHDGRDVVAHETDPAYPDAADLVAIAVDRFARELPASPAEPLYLRRPDAREPGKPKRVTPA